MALSTTTATSGTQADLEAMKDIVSRWVEPEGLTRGRLTADP